MDIVCQKLDQQTEDLRQRILNEEKVKECLKYFQKRISKIYDTAHFNAEKIDSRRMKLLILHNAIKFIKYECEKLQQNPALFSSEFGSIIYNEIMEFSERTIAHLQSNVHDCGCNNSDTLSIAPPPSIMSISLYEDSDEVNHSSNKNMVAMENDRDIDDDDSYRNKQLDQISPFITEKDLQNLNDVVVVKKDDDYEKALPHNDQQVMDMVFIPPSLQNEFEDKFSKMNMKKTKELAKKIKMDDDVVSTEDLLKFFYMEKYGTAKKREKDEKMYEDEHFKSWYEDKAKGKAHEFVNDKLKMKYDLYTFYKNKYGKSKLLKDEKEQFVYFSRSFQSWYEKKLSKKHSSVKKWLNDQKDKVSSITSNSSSEEDDNSSSGVKKVGGVGGAVMSPPNPLACHQNQSSEGTHPPETMQVCPNFSIDDLQSVVTYIDDDNIDKYIDNLHHEDLSALVEMLTTLKTKYDLIELIPLSEEDIQEVALNDLYSSMNFFVPNNIKYTEISGEQPARGEGGGTARGGTARGGTARGETPPDSTYNRVRLYSDIKHDFHESFNSENFGELSSAKTEDGFITYALKDKIQDIYQKTYYANMKNIKDDGFLKTPIPSAYKYAVMDMRMGKGITVSPQMQIGEADTSGGINEIITYGNLMDATMRGKDTPNSEWYNPIIYDDIKINLISIINTFFKAEFYNFEATDLTYDSINKMFTITINNNAFTFNGKFFEKNIVEKKLTKLAGQMTDKKVLTNTAQIILFKRMFKSLGDHIQLHELVKMRDRGQNLEKLKETIFATSDRILVADAIRNDIDVMFDLSDTFFNALKDQFGNSIDLNSVKKIPPFSEEDARQRKETYFIIYTNKTLRSDMVSFSKMFHSKLKLYINVIRKLQLFVNIDRTSYIKNISDNITNLNDNYPTVDNNSHEQANELVNRITDLVFIYTGLNVKGYNYTEEKNTGVVPHRNLYYILNYLDIVFAIIEKGIYSFETMQMTNNDITFKTEKIIRLINQYTNDKLRDPSPRSKDYKSLEDLYDELNNIFYWAFIDVSNNSDQINIVTTLIQTLSNKYSDMFANLDDGVSAFNAIRLGNTIVLIISKIFTEIFNGDAFNPLSEDIDINSKSHFTIIHQTLMDAGDKIGKSYNILPLNTFLSLPHRKRLTKNNKRLARSIDVKKLESFITKVSERRQRKLAKK
jgi:hypothetical protein